ncbi:hypothetical protein Tco_1077008, partial [Tanacetum coccineum]
MSNTRTDYGSEVVRPKIDNKDQFELKRQFLRELRENTFSGSDNEDANEHIEKVLEIVDLFHVPNITVDQLMLRVFLISLTGAASHWLRNEPTSSIKTWEDLKTKFLKKYCPPGRTAKKMKEINNFQQESDETLFQAWEHFKELLMKCPQHYLTKTQEVILFYNRLEYTDSDIEDFESRLERIYSREIHRVQIVDFQVMPQLLRDRLFARMAMEHRDEAEFLSMLRFGEVLLDLDATGTIHFQLGRARRRLSWRQFILALGLHTREEMESLSFARYWSESERMIPGKGDLHDYWRDILTDVDFLGPPPSYTLIKDPIIRICHRMMAHSIARRSQVPEKVTVTDLFYLRGLDVGSLDDTWVWVAMGLERQPDAVAGAPAIADDAPTVDEGDQVVLAPVQAPQQPPPPPPAPAKTMPQRMARLEEDVHEIRGALTQQREGRSYLYTIFSGPFVLPEARQTEDWRGQHLSSSARPTTARPMIFPTSYEGTIEDESEDEGTIKEIIRNYYDREDGETTPRFEITILKTNTPYPSRKIRRIRACTHQRPQRKQDQYAVSKEDQYAVLEIWNEYNILEDIKRGPYSKKSPIRRIQSLDTPYPILGYA